MPYSFSSPYWYTPPFRPDGGATRVCNVQGLLQTPMNEWDVTEDGSSRVDASITQLIIKLNAIGMETQFCCSGLVADHRNGTDSEWSTGPRHAYIVFTQPLPAVIGDWVIAPLGFSDTTRLCAARDATDEGLATAWKTLEERLDAAVKQYAASVLDRSP